MTCCICGGPAHPATGSQYTQSAIACRSCVWELWRWVLGRQAGKPRGGGPSFYEHITPPLPAPTPAIGRCP